MLSRDINRLLSEKFDVLVIGGGIGGAAVAYEAATRGLSAALIERNDFGAETTAGNFKTLHGGLRYLQHFDLPRLYESVREQRYFLRNAPELTIPQPFLVPCYGSGMKGKEILQLAMWLYRLLTPHRNRELLPTHQFPRPFFLGVERTLQIAPHLQREGLRGGVVFYDAIMTDADRLTLSFVASASAAGAVAANYVEAKSGIIFETVSGDRRIKEVLAKDRLANREFSISARCVVNATGPWCDILSSLLDSEQARNPARVYSKGLQVVLPPFLSNYALAVESRYADRTANIARGNRSYFFLPWNGSTLLGTADIVHTDAPDGMDFTRDEVQDFIDDARLLYPDARIKLESVQMVFGGLRPVDRSVEERFKRGELDVGGSVEPRRRDRIEWHPNLLNMLVIEGIKYTTARSVAKKAVDLLQREFTHLQPSRSLKLPLVTRPTERREGELIVSGIYEGDVRRAVREEMAVMLSDVVFRRTRLGALGYPGTEALIKTAKIVKQELGWTSSEAQSQLEGLLNKFSTRVYDSDSVVAIDQASTNLNRFGI